ncbi:TPA: hypothetical protein N0F65_008113 [Lagenidium giganteum]|uniref:Chromo domain-containing protein n=1 Tax=Lagenidium giganteum TaxID=4803 RepID=A0AAV2Z1A0_9STRA|nr:TPA: hypothetical protein N0F65_008113 [Lagenidium giganteum]
MHRQGDAYTLDFPKRTRLHPTFYVGRLKAYHRHAEDDVSPPPELQGCTGGRCERPSAAARSRDSRGSTPVRRQASFQRARPAPLLNQNGDQHWIVERIVDHRDPAGARGTRNPNQAVAHREREYRVRWLGFPPDADTWEPRGSLHRDVPDLVAEYDARHEPVGTRGNSACSAQ